MVGVGGCWLGSGKPLADKQKIMTKIGDIIFTITVTLLLLYYCLLGLIFITVADNRSLHHTSIFDKLAPILCVCGAGLIVFSLRSRTKSQYLLTRICGVLLALPIIVTDYLRSYPSDIISDKIISATFNLPNIVLILFVLFSVFGRPDLRTHSRTQWDAANR